MRHWLHWPAFECPLFSGLLAHGENVLIFFVRAERHSRHELAGLGIHVFFFGERVEPDVPVEEHPRDVVGCAVVGGLPIPWIPFRGIADFLPPEIMEFRVDRFDFLWLGPREDLWRDILMEILIVPFGRNALVAATAAVNCFDRQ